MGTPRLLGPDQSTVLWDFHDPTGAANPNTVVTKLFKAPDFGTVNPALALASYEQGATVLGYTHPPVEMEIPFMASATTDVNLWTGLGQLARYLVSISEDHPLFLEWTELASNTRYMDIVGAVNLPQLLRGDDASGLRASRASSLGPIPLRLLRQPWMRGAPVTSASDTVEDDPATGTPDGSRVYALTVSGDLPTPGKVRVQMDTGATVEKVLMAHRARQSRPSTYFSDYISDTAWFQCEATNRNWTITLGTDTAATAADTTTASPATGSPVAQINGAGSSAGIFIRRVRATRTTALDSMRGSWRLFLRCRTTAAASWELQARWGPSTADPAIYANDVVTHDTSLASSFGYVELDMGRMYIPPTVALSGVSVEIWGRRMSGSGNLNLDLVWIPPDDLVTVVIPGGAAETELGSLLTTPPYKLTADATWTAGDVPAGTTQLRLNATNEGGGLGSNSGTVYPAGRHRFRFTIARAGYIGTYRCRIVSVTGGGGGAMQTQKNEVVSPSSSTTVTTTLEFDANGSTAYQAQVLDITNSNGGIRIVSIEHDYLPSIAANESIRTDPGPQRYAVDRLDPSGNLAGYLSIEGEVPALLQPGDNHIMLRADEVALLDYEENENKLDRDLTVSVTYDPRYAL